MDPIRQLSTPVAEVRAAAPCKIDEYGEQWIMVDGVETKVANIAAAKALLVHQDKERERVRAEMDALGIRDTTEKVTITLDDGTTTEVDMVPLGALGLGVSKIIQFNSEPTPVNITKHIQAQEPVPTPKKKSFWKRMKGLFR